MIEQSLISLLIRAGRSSEQQSAETALLLEEAKPHGSINRLGWQQWDPIAVSLNPDDLIALVKGLTLAESANGWQGGSVSAVIWTFKHLQRREPSLADDLADWILRRTNNPYAPFGTLRHGARSSEEYRAVQKLLEQRRIRGEAYVRAQQENAAVERQARSEQRRRTQRDRKAAVWVERMRNLSTLPIAKKLEYIAADDIYSVGFYPTCIAREATRATLGEIDADTRIALLNKLKGVRCGPWHRLKARLLAVCGFTDPRGTPWDLKPWDALE